MFRSVLTGFITFSIFTTTLSITAFSAKSSAFTMGDAQQDHIDDIWTRTGVNLEFVKRKALNDQTCAASWTNYLGCVQALEVYMHTMYAKEATTLVTDQWLSELSSFYGQLYTKIDVNVRADFGFYKIVTIHFLKSTPSSLQSDIQKKQALIKNMTHRQMAVWRETFQKPGTPRLPLAQIIDWIQKNNLTQQNEGFLSGQAYNRFLADAVDAHSYLEPEEYREELLKHTASQYAGVGITMRSVGDQFMVDNVTDSSPAMRAGFRYKDVIVAVDGKRVDGLDIGALHDLIVGPPGTSVKVTVQRGSQLITYTVARALISPRNVVEKLLPMTARNGQHFLIGYISIGDFLYQNTCSDVAGAIGDLQDKGAQALMVDIRGNPGGQVTIAGCVVGLFTGIGRPFLEFHEKTRVEAQLTSGPQIASVPVIVLQNAGSASAAEIFAGSLQDAGVSVNVGVRSYGKGSAQSVNSYRDDSSIHQMDIARTVGYYYLTINPQKIHSPQIVGITPDIEAYDTPNAATTDQIFYREEDASPLSLSQVSQGGTTPRPEVTALYSACMKQNGIANEVYQLHQSDQLPPDYQLYTAEDAAACAVTFQQSMRRP